MVSIVNGSSEVYELTVPSDPKATDPALLRDNSQVRSFRTSRFVYPRVRVFFLPHAKLDEMPKDPAPLPLLVFIHGLGGSVAQFHPLLKSLRHNSSCLAVDLPGCGVSEFAPTSWDAYTNEALVELLDTVINDYRDKQSDQGVVLIGHSMGCSLSARLASPGSSQVANHVVGLVAICPPAGPPTEAQVETYRKLLRIPTPIFDIWRAWDARGGAESASVRRFVGADADTESKQSQFRFNRQSRTPVWRRMAWGSLPVYENGIPKGGIAGKEVWASLDVPCFLIGGGKDNVTSPEEIDKLVEVLNTGTTSSLDGANESAQPIVDAAAPIDTTVDPAPASLIEELRDEDFLRQKKKKHDDDPSEDPSTPQEPPTVGMPSQPRHPRKVVKSLVVPRGTHAMLYTQDCSHILASIIADFLSQHVTGRLSRSWQLQYLNKESKWDVKNLAKWKSVEPVSKSIAGVFRAMKTFREVDDEHSPVKFAEKWGDIVKDVIDISKDTPVYDPMGLERAGVRYHKFPTVSKIPPTDGEVDDFIKLVDMLREKQKTRAIEEGWAKSSEHAVGVHCHYGFNRTGYFIVCYLVERCELSVKEALDTFAEKRPKGIRHSHFKDQLFVRYSELRSHGA
jgi:pimeloyl-ACP methyl ester carboxylesterase/protein-tyrosine phosphatase